jgi:hypothetical protein
MAVDENRHFFVDHARAVWLWIAIADCLKRIKISGCAVRAVWLWIVIADCLKRMNIDARCGRFAIRFLFAAISG